MTPPNTYTEGTIVRVLFYFATRVLTEAEEQNFLNGLGLPAGAGVDQTLVLFDYVINDGAVNTISGLGSTLIHDATGAYHALVTGTTIGLYRCRGYSQDGVGGAVSSTVQDSFRIVPFPS